MKTQELNLEIENQNQETTNLTNAVVFNDFGIYSDSHHRGSLPLPILNKLTEINRDLMQHAIDIYNEDQIPDPAFVSTIGTITSTQIESLVGTFIVPINSRYHIYADTIAIKERHNDIYDEEYVSELSNSIKDLLIKIFSSSYEERIYSINCFLYTAISSMMNAFGNKVYIKTLDFLSKEFTYEESKNNVDKIYTAVNKEFQLMMTCSILEIDSFMSSVCNMMKNTYSFININDEKNICIIGDPKLIL